MFLTIPAATIDAMNPGSAPVPAALAAPIVEAAA